MSSSAIIQSIAKKSQPHLKAQTIGSIITVLAFFVSVEFVYAQEKPLARFNEPEVIEKPVLEFPRSALRHSGKDGWVRVGLCVEVDGSVNHIKVVDSFGGPDFEKQALKSAARYRFKPALKDGQPIAYCEGQYDFLFFYPDPRGTSEEFIKRYNEINEAIVAQRFSEAEVGLESLTNEENMNMYEFTWIHVAKSQIAIAKGNNDEALDLIEKAGLNVGTFLEPSAYAMLKSQKFTIEINQQKYGDAIHTYESMEWLEKKPENFVLIERIANELLSKFESDETFSLQVVLDDDGNASYTLFRNNVSIQVPDGGSPPEEVTLSCAEMLEDKESGRMKRVTQYEVYGYTPGKIWQVDLENHRCKIKISGQPNQQLILVQHPD